MDLREVQNNTHRHPWEISRSENIVRFFMKGEETVFADIGAGDRYFLNKLCERKTGKFYAVDHGYKMAKEDLGRFVLLNHIELLPDGKIDCLIMMDVLEHVEDEDAFLEVLLKKISAKGKFIITVPAFQSLYSSHDAFLKHFRRYKKSSLKEVLHKHHIVVERSFYFYFSLFFIRILEKLADLFFPLRKKSGVGGWSYARTSFFTKSVVLLLNMDFYFCNLLSCVGLTLPGLSLFAECRVHHDCKAT